MSLFWSKNALFRSEMHHILSYSVVLYCTVFFIALLGIYFVTFWYCMVLHCMIWYLMLSILHTFAFFVSSRWLCLARRLFPPSTHLAQPTHPTHLDHLAHPAQSTHPAFYLLFVICCIVVYCIAWYIF